MQIVGAIESFCKKVVPKGSRLRGYLKQKYKNIRPYFNSVKSGEVQKTPMRRFFAPLVGIIYPPNLTIMSDLSMHGVILWRRILKFLHLSWLSSEIRRCESFRNKYAGQRCFVTCTGPSLTISDVEKLAGEKTFGVNSILKAYPLTKWRPDFYVMVDIIAYRDYYSKDEALIDTMCKEQAFLHYRCLTKSAHGKEILVPVNFINHNRGRMKRNKITLSKDASICINDCFTVTIMAIQLAIYMGFKEIYLLGCDCNYKAEKSHFIEGEWDKKNRGKKWLDVAVARSINGYIETKKFADAQGVKIFNSTRGGMLEVFPRKSLEDVLAEPRPGIENN